MHGENSENKHMMKFCLKLSQFWGLLNNSDDCLSKTVCVVNGE